MHQFIHNVFYSVAIAFINDYLLNNSILSQIKMSQPPPNFNYILPVSTKIVLHHSPIYQLLSVVPHKTTNYHKIVEFTYLLQKDNIHRGWFHWENLGSCVIVDVFRHLFNYVARDLQDLWGAERRTCCQLSNPFSCVRHHFGYRR